MINQKGIPQRISRTSGQALVEVAILLPLLLLVILGALDLGRLFTTKIVLTNAAREGAYSLTVDPAELITDVNDANRIKAIGKIQAEIEDQGLTMADVTVTFGGACTDNSTCIVTVAKVTPLVFGNFLIRMGLVGGPITISRSVEMFVP